MEKKEHSHNNHRKRLKEKVKNHGLGCLAYHEVLELLLTYTIPRRDTNPTGHKLIEHFGSFANVIDANYYDLLKVEGVGPESALFFNVLSSLKDIYNKNKQETTKAVLNTTQKCVEFFREFFPIKANEFMVMACLSKTKKVIKTYVYSENDETKISFDIKDIANHIMDTGVSNIVLFHTHPNGDVQPSVQDISTTQRILNICLVNGIDFADHIILNEAEHYSFAKNGLLDKMKNKYVSVFDAGGLYKESLIQNKKS